MEQYSNGASFLQPVLASSVRLVHVSWKLPHHGLVAVNIDGAVMSASGESACGGVVRSTEGWWLIGFAK